jgi:EAL domain-containing protein (putative c-di-GMP-specific phosphodiesterase class I)
MAQGSIGIAGFPKHASTGDELLQRADIAMYVAKSERSGYVTYSADRDRIAEQRLAMVTAMRTGIDACEFVLEYQPILHLPAGGVLGVEALLRWDHPTRGRMWPADFIRIAEQTGLIDPLTLFVLERSLTDWPPHAARAPLMIAVNLSPRSLYDRSFPRRVLDLLDARRMDPSLLAMEITENLIMTDPEQSILCLTQLHDMGVRIILDDFGTGYSSLSYLRRLPVDQLKIDKSFVIGMAAGEDEALVRAIIDLAHNLGLSVIAEGVENEAVRDRLAVLGCDAAQGHVISRPGPVLEIARWIDQQTVGLP